MLDRHHKLLGQVVRSYIKEAEPVGSRTLEGKLGVSSATIRNDMVLLEQEGYLFQPHTSAGRVPTAQGFEFYLENLMEAREPKPAEQKTLREVLRGQAAGEKTAKDLARSMADISQEAALVAFSPDHTYYTGLANLFQQPEFADVGMVREMGQVVDHLDEALLQLMSKASNKVQVLLGKNNPLGSDCAIIYTNLHIARQPVLFGLFGPLRMDYEANIGRINYVREIVIK